MNTHLERVLEFRRTLPRHIDISIEQADIREGEFCKEKTCPAALALARAVKAQGWEIEGVRVSNTSAKVSFCSSVSGVICATGFYGMPPKLRECITNFDSYGPVRPTYYPPLAPVLPIKARLEFAPILGDYDYEETEEEST